MTIVAGEATLWRAVGVFRWISLAYVLVLYWFVDQDYRHPLAGWAVLALLTAWTATWTLRWTRALSRGAGLPTWLLPVDLAVAIGAVMITRVLDDPARIAAGAQTLPSIWVAASVLGWAVRWGRRGGLGAAAAIAVADLFEVGKPTQNTLNNIVLLVLAGLIVGYAVELVRRAQAELAVVVADRAAAAERERLAAQLHDSVLQVLAFIARRAGELDRPTGGPVGELGLLAAEQETKLRRLVSAPMATTRAEADELDLSAELTGLAAPPGLTVTISDPGEPVLLPRPHAEAVLAATAQALDNVRRHAGAAAQAWVLLEQETDRVLVTIRDDGSGIPAGRLAEASAQGRLGVVASIVGRLTAVGGRAEVHSEPGQGTWVELVVPRAGAGPAQRGPAQRRPA